MRKKGWLVLLVLSLTLFGCAMPSALSELINPTPTALPAPTALPTVAADQRRRRQRKPLRLQSKAS